MKNTIYFKLVLYMIRWQLSTPILAIVTSVMNNNDKISIKDFYNSAVANLIGSLIFFWIDKYIFSKK